MIPLIPWLAERFQVEERTLGLILGIYALMVLLTSLPLGLVSDRRGAGLVLSAGGGSMAAAAVVIALWPTPLGFLVGRAIQGLAASAVWTSALAIASDLGGSRARGRELGFLFAMSGAGYAIGPSLSGAITELWSPALFFWVMAAIWLVNTILLLAWRPSLEPGPQPEAGLSEARRQGLKLLLAGIMGVTYSVANFGLLQLTVPLLLSEKFNLSPLVIGQIFLGNELFLIIVRYMAGHWSDYGRRLPLVVGLSLAALALTGLNLVDRLVWTIPAIFLIEAGFAIMIGASAPLFADGLAEMRLARLGAGVAFGIFNIFWSIGYLLGAYGGGVALTALGRSTVLGGIAALAGLAWLISLAVIMRIGWRNRT